MFQGRGSIAYVAIHIRRRSHTLRWLATGIGVCLGPERREDQPFGWFGFDSRLRGTNRFPDCSA